MTPTRLDLGSGGRTDPGWTHVDRWSDGEYARLCALRNGAKFLRRDLRDNWDLPDESADAVVMHHVADLLTVDELDDVLRKCHRVLEPGGVLRVSCADITRGIEQAMMAGDWSWCAERKFTEHGDFDPEATLGHFILQGGARKQYLAGAWVDSLLLGAGFPSAWRVACGATFTGKPWITELDSRPDESWFVEVETQK